MTRRLAIRASRSRTRPVSPPRQVVFYMPTAAPLLLRAGPGPAGGAETQVVMLARELANRGYRVAIVAFTDLGELRSRVEGIEVIPQPLPWTRAPVLRTLVFYVQTALTLRAAGGERFVQMAPGIHTALVALVARALRRPFVYKSAGVLDFELASRDPGWIVWLFGQAVRHADEVVVATHEQLRLCRSTFGRRATLIQSIAEPAELRSAPAEAFLWIGRMTTHKQPLAYVELARAVPEATFRMIAVEVGGPEGEHIASELSRAARSVPNFELLTPRPRAELGPLFERAVAIVSTSRSEGMPNVFLEGWSRGVPALSLTHDPDGVIERERVGGHAEGSPERLAGLAREMWQRRGEPDEFAERCRGYVTREHDLERVADRWIEALKLTRSPVDEATRGERGHPAD